MLLLYKWLDVIVLAPVFVAVLFALSAVNSLPPAG
jgi:hypothetical protein